MGLSIGIGLLDSVRSADAEAYAHHKNAFARLSAFLAREGHTGYIEPEGVSYRLPPFTSSFPYSFLHYLRRAFAHVRAGATQVTPCPAGTDPAKDPRIDEELTLHMDSHLVCHSDCEGYYVPLDFRDVLYPPKADKIAGGIVGSSHALVRELARVAPAIGIEVGASGPTPAMLAALANEGQSVPLFRERMVWLALHVCATASVATGSAIVFH
jgi:hypothetical protein